MSEGLQQALIPALIGLIGTLLTIAFGIWQFRKQRASDRGGAFRGDRQGAYRGLWDMLESVHLQLRTSTPTADDYRQMAQQVNGFVLRHALYLDRDDAALAGDYFQKLRLLADAVAVSDDPLARSAWEDTGAIPPSVTRVAQLYTDMDDTRQRLLEQCRRAMNG